MKASTILALFLSLLLASCQSKEKQAEALIKENLYQAGLDASSYEPISTEITEAYRTPLNDAMCQTMAMNIVGLERQLMSNPDPYGALQVTINGLKGELQDTIAALNDKERLGWEIKHKCRIKDFKEDQSMRLIVDEDMKKVLLVDMNHPDLNYAKEIIGQLKKLNSEGAHY